MQVNLFKAELEAYCGSVQLTSLGTAESQGQWRRYEVPLAQFGCDGAGGLGAVDTLGFQSPSADADFCLDEIRLL